MACRQVPFRRLILCQSAQMVQLSVKVVCENGKLGGYNLGLEEKINRLEDEGIAVVNGKIGREFFWKPAK